MPTCEAIYEDGELEWIGDEPAPGRHRVQVTVLDSESNKHDRDEVRCMLERTGGRGERTKRSKR